MSFWRDRKVLVTGATGLLGAELSAQLAAAGAQVVALVRDWVPQSRFHRELDGQATLVRGELEDLPLLERAVNEHEIDTVFHCAAQTIVGTAQRGPVATFEANVRGTWNLLEACRRSSLVKRVEVATSDKAYGEPETEPYGEDHPLKATFPYDVSKACADMIARCYHHSFDLPVAVTRCGNLFGPGDLNWNRVIPGTIRSALRNEPPVIRSDGTFVRDYLYVGDAAHAYMLTAEKLASGGVAGEAFNFSYEIELTVLDVVQRVLDCMGRTDLQPVVLNEARHEIRRQTLSAAKAKQVLGWSGPRFGFRAGLERTVPWYRQLLEGTPTAG